LFQPFPPAASTQHDGTPELIGYLGQLLHQGIIGDKELARLVVNLKLGILENPILEEDIVASSSLILQKEGIEDYIEGSSIDPAKLLAWAERNLRDRSAVLIQREEVSAHTKRTNEQMRFNRVEAGDFIMGGPVSSRVSRSVKKPFEMMSTPVTQLHWSIIMGTNPSIYHSGPHSVVLTIRGRLVKMQPDNPVEYVSFIDVQNFITKLNDLSEKNDPILDELIPGHRVGDVYRLPTEIEWEFVVRNRGRAQGKYHFGDDEAELSNYAWTQENSENRTQPVGQLRPLVVDGGEFYDMYGNVWEFTRSPWQGMVHQKEEAVEQKAVIQPLFPRINKFFEYTWRVLTSAGDSKQVATEPATIGWIPIRGGSFVTMRSVVSSAVRVQDNTLRQDSLTGFRLVRERRP